jgi:DNA-3-methyladenine glycosylase II
MLRVTSRYFAPPFIMPTTRSTTRSVTNSATATPSAGDKRKLDPPSPPKSSQKRPRVPKAATTPTTPVSAPGNNVQTSPSASANPQELQEAPTLVPAVLTFSFEDAKQHLIRVDHRFEDLFSKMPCKPFEHLDQVHPFR